MYMNLGSDPIFTSISCESELKICFDCIMALILQIVCPELLTKPDSTALVPTKIHYYTSTSFLYQLHCQI